MDPVTDDLEGFWRRATGEPGQPGFAPYRYQRRLAEFGLPELIDVPTGCGKTMAVMAWLWRRHLHPDETVRDATPRRLVYVLPQRTLVEQVADEVKRWLDNLGLTGEVGCFVLMGGEGRESGAWRITPEKTAVLVATQDMALSGALNRRFGESRWAWPIDFGLLNNDCAWVFDEVQLMGPGLSTSRQLEGLRRSLGAAIGCTSTWMSATVDEEALATFDLPVISDRLGLDSEDRSGALAIRLDATRTVERVVTGDRATYVRDVAAAVQAAHLAGTRTLVMCNTVPRATEVRLALAKQPDLLGGAEVVLVHSRFRPGDRARHLTKAIDGVDPAGPGIVVVSTQVLEAGVDITSETLVTEAALWSSVVQRAGRCNRLGDRNATARLLWCAPPDALPYEAADIDAAVAYLTDLEGRSVTTEELSRVGPPSGAGAGHAVLRRRDLVELFDTLPDLTGADIDVSRFIRDADDRDVAVAWEDLGGSAPAPGHPLPTKEARCSVPLADGKYLEERGAWRYDHMEGRWVTCRRRDLRPGMVVIIDSARGGYDAELGWIRSHKGVVDPVVAEAIADGLGDDNAIGDDPVSMRRTRWLGLRRHLADVEAEAATILGSLHPSGLARDHLDAAITAARLHDAGKAHPVFQATLANTIRGDAEAEAASQAGSPWAKSAGSGASRHERRYFRHELASALMLLGEGSVALDGVSEPDLVLYLVAAHHGRVRLGFRSLPGEVPPPDRPGTAVALGVVDGDQVPAVEIPGMVLPSTHLDLSVMQLGAAVDGSPSWVQRMTPLRDRLDLGPFRLGFLEAVVRMADWRASAKADGDDPEVLP